VQSCGIKTARGGGRENYARVIWRQKGEKGPLKGTEKKAKGKADQKVKGEKRHYKLENRRNERVARVWGRKKRQSKVTANQEHGSHLRMFDEKWFRQSTACT